MSETPLPRRWWLRISRYALPEWRGVAVILLLMLLIIAAEVLKPWPMKIIVDRILKPGDNSAGGLALLAWMAAATVGIFVLQWLLQALQSYLAAAVGARMIFHLGAALFDHLQRQSMRFHTSNRVADLVRRVLSDVAAVRTLVLWVFLPLLTSLATLVAMFIIMWRLDPVLALVAISVAPAVGLVIRVLSVPMANRTYEQQTAEGELAATAEQSLASIAAVQAFGRELLHDQLFRGVADKAGRAYVRSTLASVNYRIGTTLVTAIGTALVFVVGGIHVLDGTITLGTLLLVLAYLAALYAPMETIAYLGQQFGVAKAGSRRVLEVLNQHEGPMNAPNARKIGRARGALGFASVTFGYDPAQPVLNDITFDLKPGETVALVGPTGSGKSTLSSLIPRFFDPQKGTVTLDGHDLRELDLQSLREQISLVLQEPFLLPLTVAENIAYGKPHATREQVIAVANAANADDFIRQLPQGYDTPLGERGATLSGGQRQRLAIARALLKDAPILILDEPTAALDVQTEAQVMDAVWRAAHGRTTLIIAHRLSTARRAQRILVLDRGRLVQSGTHEELVAREGLYRELCQAAREVIDPIPPDPAEAPKTEHPRAL